MGEVKILEQVETDETNEKETPRSSKWLTCLIEAMILALALILMLLIRWGVYEPAYIPTASMEKTLQVGDRVLIDHRRSLRGQWQRGDIVMFEAGENWGGQETLIKRIVGMPGETVEFHNGQLHINGKAISEDYLKETPQAEDTPSQTLAEGEYYVLGDNRNNSDDSRNNGPVREAEIRGRAVIVIYPLGRFGRIPKANYGE